MSRIPEHPVFVGAGSGLQSKYVQQGGLPKEQLTNHPELTAPLKQSLKIPFQLGDGTTTDRNTPVDVSGLGSTATAISAGYGHICALLTSGGVMCWGWNIDGQLGDGTKMDSSTLVSMSGPLSGVTAIIAGYYHTCALVTGGAATCWGSNVHGQLGDGKTADSSTPVDVTVVGSGITAMAAGYGHTCALLTGGAAECWGYNFYGQSGNGSTTDSTTAVDVVGLEGTGFAIVAGDYHTCALVGTGRSICWGADDRGQLGKGTTLMRLTPVGVIESVNPSLSVNYSTGQSSSFFTFSGSNFSTGSKSPARSNFPSVLQTNLSVFINGQVIATTLPVNPDGSFIFFLNTSGAGTGSYTVTNSGNPGATTYFQLFAGAPLRTQEGGGQTFTIPNGVEPSPISFIYLPMLSR